MRQSTSLRPADELHIYARSYVIRILSLISYYFISVIRGKQSLFDLTWPDLDHSSGQMENELHYRI